MKVERSEFIKKIGVQLNLHQAILIYGQPRCGKTELAKEYCNIISHPALGNNYFDLENKTHVEKLLNANLAFKSVSEPLIIIDNLSSQNISTSMLSELYEAAKLNSKKIIGFYS